MKKKTVWKWILCLFATMSAIVALIVLDAHRRASKVFKRNNHEVAQEISKIRMRDTVRPSIYGEVVSGNSWELYSNAWLAIDALQDNEKLDIRWLIEESGDTPSEATLIPLYVRMEPQIEMIRQALRRSHVDPGYRYHDRNDLRNGSVSAFPIGCRFLAGGAVLMCKLGRDSDALDFLLLLLGMARDGARGSGIYYWAGTRIDYEGHALGLTRQMLSNHSLSASELECFASALDRIGYDRDWLFQALEVEDLLIRQRLIQGMPDWAEWDLAASPRNLAWRQGFSLRLFRADTMSRCESCFTMQMAIARLPLLERIDRTRALCDESQLSPNLVVRDTIQRVGRAVIRNAFHQIEWEIMRVAVAVAWYESEKGKMPSSLTDLSPRYVPRYSSSPLTSQTVRYESGRVWSDKAVKGDFDADFIWQVRHR